MRDCWAGSVIVALFVSEESFGGDNIYPIEAHVWEFE